MSGKRILVVEDEKDIMEAIRFRLDLEGFECIEALDGEEALEKARKEKPDIIILDIMLPKMNGFKVARLLKSDDGCRHIPIIMLTALTQDKEVKLGEEAGADMYIKKPFDMEPFIEHVKRFLAVTGG